jgi:hypothetical protein
MGLRSTAPRRRAARSLKGSPLRSTLIGTVDPVLRYIATIFGSSSAVRTR